MEPEKYAILADVLSLENVTTAETHAAVLAFLRAHPEAEAVISKLAARLGEPEATVIAPETTRTFETVLQRLRVHGSLVVDRESVSEKGVPQVAGMAGRWRGGWGTQPLRWIVSTVFERFAGSAMAALFGRKVTTLTAEELERLKELVAHAEPEDA